MAASGLVHGLLEASVDRLRAAGDQADLLAHGDHRAGYDEVERAANRLARGLRDRGVGRGDRVALLAENSLAYVTGYFGILKAGGCVVALNHANKALTHAKLLRDAGAVGLIAQAAQAGRGLPQMAAACPDLRFVIGDRTLPRGELPDVVELATFADLDSLPETRPAAELTPDDLAAIIYTSGSTGLPRGVTLTHRNLTANTRQILAYLRLERTDSVLAVLPFHYSFGQSLLLTHVAVGGRLVVENRMAYPQVVLESLVRERVTGFSGVPSTYAILCAKTEFLRTELPDLRYLTQAGGAMSPALARQIREALPERIELYVMYGQTEASARLAWLPPRHLMRKLGSIGVPIPGVELTVRRPDGSECATGEVGEVVATGENIMQGYWRDPEETAKVLFLDGLHTGDLGRKDEDGFIFLVDRIKNMIKVGAHRVSPKEIEEAIAELPGVQEVCVVGVADELLGEVPEAHVVRTDAGLDEQRILRHCRDLLAQYKIPRAVHFPSELPRSAAGKILKAELIRRGGGS